MLRKKLHSSCDSELNQVQSSVKQYKDKFAEWNLQKNLSASKAQWIIMKDGKRKREGKKTVFIHGVEECSTERAERTIKRSKSNKNMPLEESKTQLDSSKQL